MGTPDAPGGGVDATSAFCDGTPHEVGPGIINAAAVDAEGRLLVVGTQFMPQPQTLFVRRFLPTGEPDMTFGDAGLVTRPGAVTDGHAVMPLADGTILVGAGVVMDSDLKPIVYGLNADGTPNGFELIDTASTSGTVERILVQGASVIIESDGILKRVTPEGAIDTTFGSNGSKYTGEGVAVGATGFVVATTQLKEVETYRVTPDGMDVLESAVMVDANMHSITTAMSRDDRITFVGDVNTDTFGTYDLIVGRVRADNTFDTASYPPNGFAVVQGVHTASTAIELPDDSILAAIYGGSMAHIKPDGTLDQLYTIPNSNLTSVAAWNGHLTAAGTLSGGHAIVVCY